MAERNDMDLIHAAEILRADPFNWRIDLDEHTDSLTVTFENGDGTDRCYVTGKANRTYTVDYYATTAAYEQGQPDDSGDTNLPVVEGDGYRLAIQFAALVDRMEH